jgi:hypothetical protein
MKRLVVGRRSQVALTAALALLMVGGLSSAAQATNAHSSSDPELCKNGGWQNLTTSEPSRLWRRPRNQDFGLGARNSPAMPAPKKYGSLALNVGEVRGVAAA